MLDTITNTEFAFRKCGALASHVFNPFAPMIRKPKEFIKSGLKHKIDTHAVINILKAKFGNIIDCPIQLIPKVDTLHLTDRQKAHYFKALYQAIPRTKTYSHMYTIYYKDTVISHIQSADKRKFIYSCMNNNTPLNKLYEKEYYKYSRYDSI
jgi:hypothetical protein